MEAMELRRPRLAVGRKQSLDLDPGSENCQAHNLHQIIKLFCPQISHMCNLPHKTVVRIK